MKDAPHVTRLMALLARLPLRAFRKVFKRRPDVDRGHGGGPLSLPRKGVVCVHSLGDMNTNTRFLVSPDSLPRPEPGTPIPAFLREPDWRNLDGPSEFLIPKGEVDPADTSIPDFLRR